MPALPRLSTGLLLGAHDDVFFGCPISDFLPLGPQGVEQLADSGGKDHGKDKKKGNLKKSNGGERPGGMCTRWLCWPGWDCWNSSPVRSGV